ncbi:MAG: hypothetical protein JRJ86_14660 [Deltaproteobacteria bacterium]|nr:hypothetical protein [Deltaproteobacteria bacterium]MBW1795508.1 hypothetical protein [Deltaproteobacteria bacterium]
MIYPKAYKLLYFIIKYFHKNFKRNPNRTELIKLLYLTDLEYYKNYGEIYSEFRYIFYHYGPWTNQFHQMLDYMRGVEIAELRKDPDENYFLYAITLKQPRHDVELEEDIRNVLFNNLFIYQESDLKQILDVVYKTEPMVSTERGSAIDFTKIPLNVRDKRLEYRKKRKKKLEEISKLQNKIENHDIDLLTAYKPFRDRANELI